MGVLVLRVMWKRNKGMNKPISILDKDYLQWVKELSKRYRQSQIKAAVKVNTEMLKFYWSLGRDIVALKAEARWGSKFFVNLSRDLKELNPKATCFSPTNLLYMKNFFRLYQDYSEITPQVGEQFEKDIFSLPWGHHKLLIDKFLQMPQKALFYVRQTVANGWSRNVLHNFIDSSLYERQGKALSNFNRTLPDVDSDLVQEITKDPYNFAFAGITKPYNERILKDALLNNITKFLTELGTGFAYVGKEYRLQIVICKEKDRIQAQYALESSSQPIAISEYDLEKFYPEKLEGTMPTIEEWEAKLGGSIEQ